MPKKLEVQEVNNVVELEGIAHIEAVYENAMTIKYVATVPLKIDGIEIKPGEEIKNFKTLRDRTQKSLLNLKRVKVVRWNDVEL